MVPKPCFVDPVQLFVFVLPTFCFASMKEDKREARFNSRSDSSTPVSFNQRTATDGGDIHCKKIMHSLGCPAEPSKKREKVPKKALKVPVGGKQTK